MAGKESTATAIFSTVFVVDAVGSGYLIYLVFCMPFYLPEVFLLH
jgi:hypothetical protein